MSPVGEGIIRLARLGRARQFLTLVGAGAKLRL
jgi:hypothetical protein